jgi:hypothetical protein
MHAPIARAEINQGLHERKPLKFLLLHVGEVDAQVSELRALYAACDAGRKRAECLGFNGPCQATGDGNKGRSCVELPIIESRLLS